MKLLFVSNLFPNDREPHRGIFNAQQVTAIARHCLVVKIIAPMSNPMPPESFASLPVVHPRFQHIPVLSRPFNGWLFAHAIKTEVASTNFDIVLVNWAYPDAYGVMLVAEQQRFPFAVTVQGSDVNIAFQRPARKRQVLRALRASRAVFTRSHALRDRLAQEGVSATTVYNGINRQLFHPQDRAAAITALGLPPTRRRILFVGNLQPIKGPAVLASAFNLLPDLPDVDLIFIGTGPDQANIPHTNRVQFVGPQPHDRIPLWMNASDLLCLPSLNEGLPNVALEAMACGLPVVASNVGGVPEIIRDGHNGLLVGPNNPVALAQALRTALARTWNAAEIRDSTASFDWDQNARTIINTLQHAIAA